MLDKSVREKREELRKNWAMLKALALDEKNDNTMSIRNKQKEVFNKWDFYDNVIKRVERKNYEMQDQKSR